MTHKARDCVERPRAKGAKLTGAAIAADEAVAGDLRLEYEAKRDRYNGYDAAAYSSVVQRFELVEAAKAQRVKERALERSLRREARAARRAAGAGGVSEDSEEEGGEGPGEGPDGEDEEEKLADAANAEFGQVTRRVRSAGGGASSSVRNLRIREDTAKYLINLDLGSAHYDPKSRSMREDPRAPGAGPATGFAGDNAFRRSGDAAQFGALEAHAWVAAERGQSVHAQAAPSAAEALFAAFKAKKEALAGASKLALLEKYGNAATPGIALDAAMLRGATEAYAEYDATGRLLRGAEAPVGRSRYEEDAYPGNHTSVFGSWWAHGRWGFACCHATTRSAYCTGAAGLAAAAAAPALEAANAAAKAARDREAMPPPVLGGAKAPGHGVTWGSDVPSDVALDEGKLAAALAVEAARQAAPVVRDERKRAYNSLAGGGEVTEEEMEAWRRVRAREEDPLAAVQGRGTDGYDLV